MLNSKKFSLNKRGQLRGIEADGYRLTSVTLVLRPRLDLVNNDKKRPMIDAESLFWFDKCGVWYMFIEDECLVDGEKRTVRGFKYVHDRGYFGICRGGKLQTT